MKQNHKKKICFVVSAPGTAQSFLRDHILSLSQHYAVYLVANFVDDEFTLKGLTATNAIRIVRNISITADIKAVWALTRYFKKMKFDAVHSVTPKAGLITALAAKFAGIRHRIHIYTGQVWATRTGFYRFLLKNIDRLIAKLDNHILADGESQRQFLISEGVISANKSQVLGAGSICGANTALFSPKVSIRQSCRKALNIPDNKIVFAYLGRLNHEKGIYELLNAFNHLAGSLPDIFLLIIGRDEEHCMSHINEYENIKENDNFIFYGPTSAPNETLQAADVFCLPSYREGFGMSVVEASCLGIPVICSDAYGLADTIVDNETGIRCKVADVQSLENAMKYMYDNPHARLQMGQAGRQRVLKLFTGEQIVKAWNDFYDNILG